MILLNDRLKEAVNLFQNADFDDELAFPERILTQEDVLNGLPFAGTGEISSSGLDSTEGLEGENNQPPGDMNPGVH